MFFSSPRFPQVLLACVVGGMVAFPVVLLAASPEIAIDRTETPPYQFTEDEASLLESVQLGCFNYLWQEVGQRAKLTKDRRTTQVASLAGVGFQLSSLPVGVEHGWISREEAQSRALAVLRSLEGIPENRRWGVFLHFVNADDGRLYPPHDNEISTVDHSLFLAGALPAATYFGGEVAEIVARLAAATEWPRFIVPGTGMVSFGWKPSVNTDVHGEGQLMELTWQWASGEERLVYFMASGCPTPEYGLAPKAYYQLKRPVGQLNDMPPFVLSWNGALFTYVFSHCWIDYRALQADDPGMFGVDAPRVDWFENSRRATLAHRQRCLELAGKYRTFSEDRWGLSPCMGFLAGKSKPDYLVQELQPNLCRTEQVYEGTIAPYAAGSAIMFTPRESVAALQEFRGLQTQDGEPLVWRDPEQGGYALADSFNLDLDVACDDNVSIDAGPMLLAIENVRTGLVWRLFMQHDIAQRAVERLQLRPREVD